MDTIKSNLHIICGAKKEEKCKCADGNMLYMDTLSPEASDQFQVLFFMININTYWFLVQTDILLS